jgi:hypothetical protein
MTEWDEIAEVIGEAFRKARDTRLAESGDSEVSRAAGTVEDSLSRLVDHLAYCHPNG